MPFGGRGHVKGQSGAENQPGFAYIEEDDLTNRPGNGIFSIFRIQKDFVLDLEKEE